MLNAETNRPADDQGIKSRIRKHRRRHKPGQNVQSRDRRRVAHQGEVNDILDLAISELGPDTLVFASYLFLRRMEEPFDSEMAQVVEADADGTVDLSERHADIHTQARSHREFDII